MNEQYEQYEHHGNEVWCRKHLKGRHREHCLCWACEKMKPGTDENCPIASELYALCVKHKLTTPVFECPFFVPQCKLSKDDLESQ